MLKIIWKLSNLANMISKLGGNVYGGVFIDTQNHSFSLHPDATSIRGHSSELENFI